MTRNARDNAVLVIKGLLAAVAFIVTVLLTHGEWSLILGLIIGIVVLLFAWVLPAIVRGIQFFLDDSWIEPQMEHDEQKRLTQGE